MGLGLLMSLFLPGLMAQKVGFSVSAGLTSQRMDDLKYLQEYILSTYPVEGKITSSFPPFTTASINLMKEAYDYLHFGGGYTFSTSGGKSSYSDRTGSIITEMDVTSHRLGAFITYSIWERDRIDIALYGRVGLNLTTLEISSGVNILGLINRVYNQYRSLGPSVSGGLELMYKFENLALGIHGGYLVDIPGNLRTTDGDDELTDPNDRERVLTADWTGWQVGIKTRFWLNY
jgi:hypothetical protein